MNPKVLDLHQKRSEVAISNMGARIADAIELSEKAKELSAKSTALLVGVQQDLEELYVSMADGKESK